MDILLYFVLYFKELSQASLNYRESCKGREVQKLEQHARDTRLILTPVPATVPEGAQPHESSTETPSSACLLKI